MERLTRTCAALFLLVALILPSCITQPRTSNPDERAYAYAGVTVVQNGIATAYAAGKLKQDAFELATRQIADVRAFIASTETAPTTWLDIYGRVQALSLEWIGRNAMDDPNVRAPAPPGAPAGTSAATPPPSSATPGTEPRP